LERGHQLRVSEPGGFAGGEACVELVVRGIEVVCVEHHQGDATVAALVRLDDRKELDVARADVTVAALEALPEEHETLAPGGEDLRGESTRGHLEHRSERREMLIAIELDVRHRPTVAHVELRCEVPYDALPIARLPRLSETVHESGRRILDAGRR